jgi:transposase
MAHYIDDRRDTQMFVDGSLDSLTPENSVARLIWAALEGLCFDRFDAVYRNDDVGRAAVDPRRLVGVWVLGLLRGITGSPRLAAVCGQDVEFRWMLGDARVQKSTLCAFRKDHGEALADLCTQVLGAMARSNLLPGESFAVDGTVIRAASSCRKVTTKAKTVKRLERLREVIAEKLTEPGEDRTGIAPLLAQRTQLEAALKAMEQLNLQEDKTYTLTEPDAKLMKLKNGGYAPAYNVQVTTDLDTGAIVHAEVVTQGSDAGQLKPQMDHARQVLNEARGHGAVKTVAADSAYHDTLQLLALEKQGVACVVPEDRNQNRLPKGVTPAFRAEAFSYDPQRDVMMCPAGQMLTRRKWNNAKTAITYQANASACAACPHKPECCAKTKGGRSVNRPAYPELLQTVAGRVKSESGRASLRARHTTAEGIFARITERLGLRRFRAWTLAGATAEVRWRQLAHNLMLLTGHWKPMVYPKAKAA